MVVKFLEKLENEWKLEREWKKINFLTKEKKRTLIAAEISPRAFYLPYKRQDEY